MDTTLTHWQTKMRRQLSYKIKHGAVLKNKITNETTTGDIVNEENIDGKMFYVLKVGPRFLKLAKEGYSLIKMKTVDL